MLEAMSEDAQKKVYYYTQKLFTSGRPANPFILLTKDQILEELDESEQQIAEGCCQEAVSAIVELRKKHGFV